MTERTTGSTKYLLSQILCELRDISSYIQELKKDKLASNRSAASIIKETIKDRYAASIARNVKDQ